jgi:hypothetical protein
VLPFHNTPPDRDSAGFLLDPRDIGAIPTLYRLTGHTFVPEPGGIRNGDRPGLPTD